MLISFYIYFSQINQNLIFQLYNNTIKSIIPSTIILPAFIVVFVQIGCYDASCWGSFVIFSLQCVWLFASLHLLYCSLKLWLICPIILSTSSSITAILCQLSSGLIQIANLTAYLFLIIYHLFSHHFSPSFSINSPYYFNPLS